MRARERRLRQQPQADKLPVPVWIEFDTSTVTADQAIKAAIESGQVPAHAWLVVLPAPIQSRDVWSQQCKAELVAREKIRLLAQHPQAGTVPENLSTNKTRRPS